MTNLSDNNNNNMMMMMVMMLCAYIQALLVDIQENGEEEEIDGYVFDVYSLERCVCVCVCMYVCMYVFICLFVCPSVYLNVSNVCMYVCMYVRHLQSMSCQSPRCSYDDGG